MTYQEVLEACKSLLHDESESDLTASFIWERHSAMLAEARPEPSWVYKEVVGSLVERYKANILAIARRQAHGSHVEEVVQIVSLKILNNLHQFKGGKPNSFISWVKRITENTARGLYRRKQFEQLDDIESLLDKRALEQDCQKTKIRVNHLIEILEPEEKDLIWLHYFVGLSCSEISRHLETTEITVRLRLFRIRKKMREHELLAVQ